MTPPLPTLLHPERSAHATLRGYLYQTCLGVLRWLDLKDGEILLCEGDEDLDRRILGGGGVSEQVKAYSGGLGLADRAVIESLRLFLRSYVTLRRNGETRSFLFTTTAYQKRSRKGGLGVDLLEAWQRGDRTSEVCTAVRSAVQDGPDWLAEPLDWLDAEPERWSGFLDAVEWSFNAPDLGKIRVDLRQRLAASPTTRSLPAEPFIDRLVVEVLEMSSRPEVRDRLLTRDDLSRLAEAARREQGDWERSPAAGRIRRVFDEVDQIGRILHDNVATLPPNPSPGKLLTASYEVIPFEESGRRGEIEVLTDWCNSEETRSVLLLTGEGGSGKTRLAIEWCRRLRHQGWHAGFLLRDVSKNDLTPILEGVAPRLVVVDYAETRLEVVRPLLYKVGVAVSGGPKMRLLLLARRAGDWWEALARGTEGHEVEDLLARSPLPRLVTPLVQDPGERNRGFHAAVEGFAFALGKDAPKGLPVPDLSKKDFERALYLQMAALAALDGRSFDTAGDALERTLSHERSFWKNAIKEIGLDGSLTKFLVVALENLAAGLALIGGAADAAQTQSAFNRILQPNPARPDLTNTLLDLLRRFYGGSPDGRFLEPIQPDLLGEQLVAESLRRDAQLLEKLLNGANAEEGYSTLTVLTRLAQRLSEAEEWLRTAFQGRLEQLAETALEVAVETGDPIGLVLAQEIEKSGTEDLVRRLAIRTEEDRFLPSLHLQEVGLAATQKELQFLLAGESSPSTESLRTHIGWRYDSLGNRLGGLGRHAEALQATLVAVSRRRELAENRPDEFLPSLAMSLNNLCGRFSALMQPEEALGAIRESIEIWQRGDRQRYDWLPDLAGGFVNLGHVLNDLGLFEQSLQATDEAVQIFQWLNANRPGTFLGSLAKCLNNRAYTLNELGHLEEARETAGEAVKLYRQLAADRPDAYYPDLAMSLTNLSKSLSHLNQHQGALQTCREVVEIYRQLALRRPVAFTPDLAKSLNNLALVLGDLGQFQEASSTAQSAVEIYRHLVTELPTLYLPYLAMSSNTLSIALNNLDRNEEAFQAAEEAVQILSPLFLHSPTSFGSWMGTCIRNYNLVADAAGREPNAKLLQPLMEALPAEEVVSKAYQSSTPTVPDTP